MKIKTNLVSIEVCEEFADFLAEWNSQLLEILKDLESLRGRAPHLIYIVTDHTLSILDNHEGVNYNLPLYYIDLMRTTIAQLHRTYKG